MSDIFPFSDAAVNVAINWIKVWEVEEHIEIDKRGEREDFDDELDRENYARSILLDLYKKYEEDVENRPGVFKAMDTGPVEDRDNYFTGSEARYQKHIFLVMVARGMGVEAIEEEEYIGARSRSTTTKSRRRSAWYRSWESARSRLHFG